MISRLLTSLLAAVTLAPTAALAHHSPAASDPPREVVVFGTVREVLRKNPHSYLILEVDDGKGESVLQEIELDGPSVVQASGLTREALSIEVAEDSVVIDVDLMGTRRVVHLDQQHPDELEPSLLAHSIGWWEGETLVIDAVGFPPHRQGVAFGVPSGPGKHLVDRLTLSADGLRLEYAFTLEDPDFSEGSIAHTQVWDHRPDLEPTEACDPEVARRFMEERSP